MSSFGIIYFNIISVRREASHRSEMVTQALFGETIIILDQDKEWTKIQLTSDGYIGWILSSHYKSIPELFKNFPSFNIKDWKSIQSTQIKTRIPKGALLWSKEQMSSVFGDFKKYSTIRKTPKNKITTIKSILKTAEYYLGTPYLWGGKSSIGIDCSGLCQIAFTINGYQLPRDAYQQAEIGDLVQFEKTRKGDLAFFKNQDDKITHVGIIYSTKNNSVKIIHSSGYVKIDKLDAHGIINNDTQEYSHQLAYIKRIID